MAINPHQDQTGFPTIQHLQCLWCICHDDTPIVVWRLHESQIPYGALQFRRKPFRG